MASMANSFDLLKNAEATKASSSKKKNKAKDNAQAANSNAQAANVPAPALKPSSSAPLDILEVQANNTRAARSAKTVGEFSKLWQDWTRQGSERGPKANKYKDASGSLVDFRQVLLTSQALEISLENAIVAGLTTQQQDTLTNLFQTYSSLDGHAAHYLAGAIIRLAGLVQDESWEVKSAAQRAVYALVAQIKAGEPSKDAGAGASQGPSWVKKIEALAISCGKEQNLFQKMTAAGRGPSTKEHAEIARKIFNLTSEQFDLLQSGPSTAPGTQNGTGPALEELRAAIHSKIQVEMDTKPKGGKASNDAAQKRAALANLRKEEEILSWQYDAVVAQVRQLEAQLSSLKAQQQQLENSRAQLQQRMRALQDPTAQGKKGPLGLAHHQEELEVVDTIYSILTSVPGGAGLAPQVPSVSPHALSYDTAQAARQFLEVARATISEIPSKITFCKQRRTQAEGLLKLGSKEGQRIQAEADKLMSETVKTADDLLHTALQVMNDLKSRSEAILRLQPAGSGEASGQIQAAHQLLHEIQTQYDTIQAAIRPPAPPPAPVAAPARAAPAPAAAPARAAPAAAAAPLANGKHVAAPVSAPVATPSAPVSRPVSAAPAPQVAAAAPVATLPEPSAPKNAFDAAAEYLASAKRIQSAAARSESPVAAPVRKPASAGASRPAAAAPPAPSRQWGKPAGGPSPAAEGIAADSGLPTPAEAMAAVRAPAANGAPSAAPAGEGQGKKKGRAPRA